jgi:hypothetical protein
MRRQLRAIAVLLLLGVASGLAACAPADPKRQVKLLPTERFDWVPEPIEFSPPPTAWYREGDNGGGLLGVRFILSNGGGQVMSVAAYRQWSEKLPKKAILELLGDLDSTTKRATLNDLGRLRVQVQDPLTEGETQAAYAVNAAVDRAQEDLLADRPSFVRSDIQGALDAIDAYRPSLAEFLPRMKLKPEDHQGIVRYTLGEGRDTVLAGLPAYASYDTLYAPEQKLLYRQVYWVVDGTAFQAIYQGRPENQPVFDAMVESIRFPEGAHATP